MRMDNILQSTFILLYSFKYYLSHKKFHVQLYINKEGEEKEEN